MELSDPFPVEFLSNTVKVTILNEFQGRHPTVLEVASVPDAHWLKLPAMGPVRLARLRSLTDGICNQLQPSALTRMSAKELLAQHQELVTQQDLLQENLRDLRDKARANKAELWRRGVSLAQSDGSFHESRQAR
jgi:hypothetical protein